MPLGLSALDVICTRDDLGQYLIVPPGSVTASDIARGLCSLNADNAGDFAKIIFEETNVQDLMDELAKLLPRNILDRAGITKEELEEALDAVDSAIYQLDEVWDPYIRQLQDALEDLLDEPYTDYDVAQYAGEIICGDDQAFKLGQRQGNGNDDMADDSGDMETLVSALAAMGRQLQDEKLIGDATGKGLSHINNIENK